MSYQQLLLSAREQGELRRQQKGLNEREQRLFPDGEEDVDLLSGKGSTGYGSTDRRDGSDANRRGKRAL